MKFFLGLVISLMIVLPAVAQNSLTIRGVVMDSQKVALPGVAVHLKPGGGFSELTVYTDAEGKFDFTNLSKGDYELQAKLPGFQTLTSIIILVQSVTPPIEITLAPQLQKPPRCNP